MDHSPKALTSRIRVRSWGQAEMRRKSLLLILAIGFAALQVATSGEPPSQATSASRQFVVACDSPLRASSICAFAERVKRSWAREFQVSEKWRTRVVVVVQPGGERAGEGGRNVRIEAINSAMGPFYRIVCQEPPTLDDQALMPLIVRALCADLVQEEPRNFQSATRSLEAVPWWMISGLTDLIGEQDSIMRPWIHKSLVAGHQLPAGTVMAREALPSLPVDHERYRAHAWLLTHGLLSLSDGPQRFVAFMGELTKGTPWEKALVAMYPTEFPDRTALEKWWALLLVSRSSAMEARSLTFEETGQQLDSILGMTLLFRDDHDQVVDRSTVGVADWWRYNDELWLKPVLTERVAQLTLLRSQGHPLFEPVLARYIESLQWLYAESTTRFGRVLRKAQAERSEIAAQYRAIQRHLDAFEQTTPDAAQPPSYRGYFETLQKIDGLENKRRNPISDYLDRFDQ
jgi:hypothetical protein